VSSSPITLDIRGQVCPSCLLLTLRAVNDHFAALHSGAVSLMVLTDSRDATETIPEAIRNMGLSATVGKEAGCYRVLIGAPTERE
jgi:TusA-related sulfurtransferase